MEQQTIALVGGCSGGHITPAITLAKQHIAQKKIFFIRAHQFDRSMIPADHDFSAIIELPITTAPRKSMIGILKFSKQFMSSLFMSIHMLRKYKVSSVITTGSYVALPVCTAARLLRIPIILYELNVEPGQAIKVLAHLAKTIHICFPQTAHELGAEKCVPCSYPIRMTEQDKMYNIADVIKQLSFDPARKTLFITGGSQGSGFVNDAIIAVMKQNPDLAARWQIIHQAGTDQSALEKEYATLQIPAHVFSYESHLAPYFCAADFMISRAGAGSLAEIIFFNKQAIVIPHKNKTTTHQELNAHAFAQQHPAFITIVNQDEYATKHIAEILHHNS